MSESPKKKGPFKPSPVMAAAVALVLIALCFAVPKIYEWSAERERTEVRTENTASAPRERARATRAVAAQSETCPVVSDDWRPYSPPQGDDGWPAWTENIPRCHRIVWCNPDENLVCKEREAAGYVEQCRIGTEARDWTPEACRVGTASRVRSKTGEPMIGMVYKFQFIG